ncbi:MAG: hypothetical protein WCG05_05685, partial [Alphaproteobacteria bacterium]
KSDATYCNKITLWMVIIEIVMFKWFFAVKNRGALMMKQWKNDLEKVITGIIKDHKPMSFS